MHRSWRRPILTEVLRLPLDHFVHDVERTLSKPTGRGPFSAGFFDLDALARLAAHRLDTQGVERLGKEAYKARALGVTEFRDIRVLASSPFLRNAALGRDAKLQFPIVPGATPLLDRTFEDAGARQFRFLQTYKEGKTPAKSPIAELLLETIWKSEGVIGRKWST